MTDIVLIGCGAVSQRYYAPALKELEWAGEVNVVALVDPDPGALESLGVVFPHAERFVKSHPSSLLRGDLAIVASPPAFHADQTIEALECGLSVLCEKPMATGAREGRAMIAAAKAANRVLAVGLVRRFLPAVEMIHNLLRQRLLGRVNVYSAFEGGLFRWPVSSMTYFTDAPGGVLFDLGSHALDLALWWFGEADAVTYEDDAMGGVDVNGRVQLQHRDGPTGTIQLSRDWDRPNEYRIECEDGWIYWTVNESNAVEVGLRGSRFAMDARLFVPATGRSRKQRPATFERCFVEQIRNVVAAHHGQAPLAVPGEVGLRPLELIEACYGCRWPLVIPWLSEVERAGPPVIQVPA